MSIRARLLWITLLATLLPALLIWGRFLQERSAATARDTTELIAMAQRRAETLVERIHGTAQLHYGLARASDLFTNDREACSTFLSTVREAYPQYTGILTIKPDGRLFCDSLHSGRELDLRDRGYFKAALLARDTVVLEAVFGRLTGTAILQIAYPVRSAKGDLQFISLASLNLQKLAAVDQPTASQAQMMLVDDRGVVLSMSRQGFLGLAPGASVANTPLFQFATQQARSTTVASPAGVAVGSAQGLRTIDVSDPQGRHFKWAASHVSLTDGARLYVLAGVDDQALQAGPHQRFEQDMTLLAFVALSLFLAVWLLAEWSLRRPIVRLTRMAQQLASGDLSARIAPPLPRGELGELTAMLNQAAESLERQRDDIDRLNHRLRQSQRLEALGQLTGGIAHDFNNLLTVVMGNAELMVELAEHQPEQRQLALMIARAAERGADLTRHLLAFARKQALDPKACDVNQLVARLDPMLRRTLGEHIEIELIRGAGLWAALVDPGQLENALLNLCLNARDAMPQGGRLTLETANTSLDQTYSERYSDVTPGQYVMLAVSDTGQGIPAAHLEQVFEPFFTTKEKGKGTGLGLAMVYGFTKQSAGHISIYSEPGQGTTVKLYLPRSLQSGPPEPERAVKPVMNGGSELVLLVEDDDLVRHYACEQLYSLGYQVLEASNGHEALDIVRERKDVQLLFTDVVMPGGMTGRELADAARALRPDLHVLYTSGYTENAIVHHGRLDPGVQLLTKPYRRADLAKAIRQALGR